MQIAIPVTLTNLVLVTGHLVTFLWKRAVQLNGIQRSIGLICFGSEVSRNDGRYITWKVVVASLRRLTPQLKMFTSLVSAIAQKWSIYPPSWKSLVRFQLVTMTFWLVVLKWTSHYLKKQTKSFIPHSMYDHYLSDNAAVNVRFFGVTLDIKVALIS